MLAATKVKMSGSKKKKKKKKKMSKNTYDISSIKRISRKFQVVVVQNNGKEMYKKVCCTCKIAVFAN